MSRYVLHCSFFCFKQKTAYEMRISDWSSDVCSSDLSIWTRSPVRCSPPWNRPTLRKGRRGARGARPSFKDAGARLGDALAATAKAETKLAQAKIGRASCRESVCQSV